MKIIWLTLNGLSNLLLLLIYDILVRHFPKKISDPYLYLGIRHAKYVLFLEQGKEGVAQVEKEINAQEEHSKKLDEMRKLGVFR